MKQATYKKVTKMVNKVMMHLESAHEVVNDIQRLINADVNAAEVKKPVAKVAKKRGRKKKS
jgi:hypothetical protein